MTSTGGKIKEAREAKGITQKKLGELSGISESTIRKYELGNRSPKIETLLKIATALDVPVITLKSDLELMGERIINSIDFQMAIMKLAQKEEEKLLGYFRELNSEGREEAIKQISNLTKIHDYTFNEEPYDPN